jgi:hypothetical protein
MDLDWFSEDNFVNAELFNDNSIIKQKTIEKNITKTKNSPKYINTNNKYKKELDASECFNFNLESTDKMDILEILNYLSFVSNNLRTIIRNKNLISGFDKETFENLMKYLFWLKDACFAVKQYFICSKKRENINENIFKPFKTSSYKFCNYKNNCSIHKNKNKTCDKNHFVFDMVLIDINNLILSLEIITSKDLDYLNWIFSDNILSILVNEMTDDKTPNCEINKLKINDNVTSELVNLFFIDKNVILKCFDVISYVLNKMFEESATFLNYDIESYLINL